MHPFVSEIGEDSGRRNVNKRHEASDFGPRGVKQGEGARKRMGDILWGSGYFTGGSMVDVEIGQAQRSRTRDTRDVFVALWSTSSRLEGDQTKIFTSTRCFHQTRRRSSDGSRVLDPLVCYHTQPRSQRPQGRRTTDKKSRSRYEHLEGGSSDQHRQVASQEGIVAALLQIISTEGIDMFVFDASLSCHRCSLAT